MAQAPPPNPTSSSESRAGVPRIPLNELMKLVHSLRSAQIPLDKWQLLLVACDEIHSSSPRLLNLDVCRRLREFAHGDEELLWQVLQPAMKELNDTSHLLLGERHWWG